MIVAEALKLGDLKQAKLLAGAEGLHRKIKAAEVMEVPDINEWLTEGILIISTFYSVRDNPAAQLSMFRKLIEVDGAGLIVKIGRYVHSLPQEMIDLANEKKMPIIAIPVDVSFVNLLTVLFERKFKEAQTEEAKTLEDVYKLGEATELQQLLENMAELTGENVLIEGEDDQLIACANHRSTAERRSFRLFSQPDKKSTSDKRMIRLPFKKREQGVACSIVISVAREQRQLWEVVFQKAATFLEEQMRLLLRKRIYKVRKRMHEEQASIMLMVNEQKHPFEESFEGVTFGVVVLGEEALLPETSVLQPFFFYRLYQIIDHNFPGAYVMQKEESLYLFFKCSRERSRGDAVIAVRHLMTELAEDTGLLVKVGFSPVYQSLSMAKQAVAEALTASKNNLDPSEIVLYEQMGFKRMMAKLANNGDVQAFASNMLKSLDEGDGGTPEALLHTLTVFLQENGNHSKAAEKLYVHRRTLKYRLEKIEQRLMLDLGNSEVRFLLYFALKMKKLL